MTTDLQERPWMKKVLILAGAYNLVWGILAVVLPLQMLSWLGVNPLPTYPQFWQCIGMIVGVFGVGYLIAAQDPYRHWPLTLVGLLGKIFGPIGFVAAINSGTLPVEMGWTILTNDLVWWIPFAMILWGAVRFHQSVGSAYQMPEADDPLRDLCRRRLENVAPGGEWRSDEKRSAQMITCSSRIRLSENPKSSEPTCCGGQGCTPIWSSGLRFAVAF